MPLDIERLLTAAADAVPEGIIAIYLFGSHATGRAHHDSDVDVAVLLDRRLYGTPARRFDARLALASR